MKICPAGHQPSILMSQYASSSYIFDRVLNMPRVLHARVLNMLQYSYNDIIIITNVIILEFFSAQFVHPAALQLTILSFLTRFKT